MVCVHHVCMWCSGSSTAVHKYRAASGAGGEGVWQRVRIGLHSIGLEGYTKSLGWALPLYSPNTILRLSFKTGNAVFLSQLQTNLFGRFFSIYILRKGNNREAPKLCVNVIECHSRSDNYTLARNMKQIVFGRSWLDSRCLEASGH